MDPDKLTSAGMRLIRQYLQFIESNGANLGDRVLEKPTLNPFEMDVRDTLQRHLNVTAQYGTSGYLIDFAAHHPTKPGRYVLAIECDGATYHSSVSARDRDRLRQEQLERIGWRFHRIWSTEWFHDKGKALAKVLAAFEQAVRDDEDGGMALVPRSELLSPVNAINEDPSRSGTRPPVSRGLLIDHYTFSDLVSLAQWIESDQIPRTLEEVILEMMQDLGFQKRGRRIVEALTAAVERARARHRREGQGRDQET